MEADKKDMTAANKKIDWCLEKGKTEKRKHRGLRKIEPSIEESKKHIEKAEHNIKFLERLRKLKEFNDWIFPAAFYSIVGDINL